MISSRDRSKNYHKELKNPDAGNILLDSEVTMTERVTHEMKIEMRNDTSRGMTAAA